MYLVTYLVVRELAKKKVYLPAPGFPNQASKKFDSNQRKVAIIIFRLAGTQSWFPRLMNSGVALKKRKENMMDNEKIKFALLIMQVKYTDVRCSLYRCTRTCISTYRRYMHRYIEASWTIHKTSKNAVN